MAFVVHRREEAVDIQRMIIALREYVYALMRNEATIDRLEQVYSIHNEPSFIRFVEEFMHQSETLTRLSRAYRLEEVSSADRKRKASALGEFAEDIEAVVPRFKKRMFSELEAEIEMLKLPKVFTVTWPEAETVTDFSESLIEQVAPLVKLVSRGFDRAKAGANIVTCLSELQLDNAREFAKGEQCKELRKRHLIWVEKLENVVNDAKRTRSEREVEKENSEKYVWHGSKTNVDPAVIEMFYRIVSLWKVDNGHLFNLAQLGRELKTELGIRCNVNDVAANFRSQKNKYNLPPIKHLKPPTTKAK